MGEPGFKMTTVETLVAAIDVGAPPVRVMELASQLADETAYAPLTLARLGWSLGAPQLSALGVFHAASQPRATWAAPLVLYSALSNGQPPEHPTTIVNTLTLVGRVATGSPHPLPFLAGWVSWFLVDSVADARVAEDAEDTLRLLEASQAVGWLVTLPAHRTLRSSGWRGEPAAHRPARSDSADAGIAWLRSELKAAAHGLAERDDAHFCEQLLAAAERDQEATEAAPAAARDLVEGRIAWRVTERLFGAAQNLLALLESLTRKQAISEVRFATGSFIVEVHGSGRRADLPDLRGPHPGGGDASLRGLSQILAGVSAGELHVSVRTVPAGGGRPTTWAPTRAQAATLLAAPLDETSTYVTRRVILRGIDPDAGGGGFARLNFYGLKDTVKANLASRYVADGWVVNGQYDAQLVRHQRPDGTQWDLLALRPPSSDADHPAVRTYPPSEVPRVSGLRRLLEFLTLLKRRGGAQGIRPAEFGVQASTTMAYWLHFAQAIEAVDGHEKLTADGDLAVAGGVAVLRKLFLRSRLAQGLRAHLGRDQLRGTSVAEVRLFVESTVPGVQRTTLDQRVGALAHLVRECADAE